MAKKKQEPALAPAAIVVEEPPKKILTKLEMMEIRALQAEARVADLQAQMRITERDVFLKEVDPKNRILSLNSEIRKQTEACRLAKETLEKLQKSIEERLQINLKEYAYNDDSGELQKVDL